MIIYDGKISGKLDKDGYKAVIGSTIEAIANDDKDVVYLDADLMNSSGTLGFAQRNPEQAFNVGVAEANMMGMAGGLSTVGKKPYVHSFGPFASRRSYDQTFLSIAYAGNSVRILGTDPGVCAAFNGGTHMPFEDIGLMRLVPTATVIETSDGAMLQAILHAVKDRKGLTYIRTTRKAYPTLYSEDHDFEIGKGEVVRDGSDITIFAVGLMVSEALHAAEMLQEKGISARVVDLFTIKPLDDALVIRCAEETGAVLTSENHNVIGGMGDAVIATLAQQGVAVPMKKHGINDMFGSVGPQDYLQEHYGLTADEIAKQAEAVVARK